MVQPVGRQDLGKARVAQRRAVVWLGLAAAYVGIVGGLALAHHRTLAIVLLFALPYAAIESGRRVL